MKYGHKSGVVLDRDGVLALIEQAAINGTRCPQGTVVSSHMVRELAREGLIRIEISGKNWRRVTLLKGEHAGKSSAPDPEGRAPYRTIEGERDYWHTRGSQVRGSAARAPISLPFKDGRRV